MNLELAVNCQKVSLNLTQFIKKTVKQAGFSKVIVGLSGGVDSVTSFVLAERALGIKNILVGLFPYGSLSKKGFNDAKMILKKFEIPASNINLIDIKPLVDPIIKKDPKMSEIRKGNIMARMRMILLFDLSQKYHCLVLGTENKTEHLLGYFTRFGDEASDIEPLRNLYKTQVRRLALYLGVPSQIIKKTPTAGLWIGQTDEGEFGFTYREADQILHLYHEQGLRREAIIKAGFRKEIVDKVILRMKTYQFKHLLPFTS